jgi:hypothetical protein
VSTPRNVTSLIEDLTARSSGEIRVVVSNPTDRAGGERFTIEAYGEQYDTKNLAEADALLHAWNSALVSAGVVALPKEFKDKVCRATLFRTSTGGWSVQTQALASTPITDGWSVPTRTSEVATATAAANYEVAEHGYVTVFTWIPIPERPNTLVTILQKV